MPEEPTYDVQPGKSGNREVKREGGKQASSTHETKQEAVERGRGLAKERRGQLRIKGKDGKIQEERTYREDPHPPEG